MVKLFGIQRLQHNVRKLFYLTASSQDHSFKDCGKTYLLLSSSETELFSKTKKKKSITYTSVYSAIHPYNEDWLQPTMC